MAIKSDGSLWGWGNNWYGQIGDGTKGNDRLNPIKIMDDVMQVSAGTNHTAAIKSDGSLWFWGDNYYGKVGDGPISGESVSIEDGISGGPVKIMDDVLQVSAGNYITAAIKNDGSLWILKTLDNEQTGDYETNEDRLKPVKIMDDVIQVSMGGYHTMVIKRDNSLWGWGHNSNGELGDGTTENKLNPVKIMDNVVQVSTSYWFTMAIKSDGSLWAWGRNKEGELGDGTTDDKLNPVKIMDNVIRVSTGGNFTMAVKSDGSLWAWGLNRHEELSSWGGYMKWDLINSLRPMELPENVIQVSLGGNYIVIIKGDGSLWGWGMNDHGQLGSSIDKHYSFAPLKIIEDIKQPVTSPLLSVTSPPNGDSIMSMYAVIVLVAIILYKKLIIKLNKLFNRLC